MSFSVGSVTGERSRTGFQRVKSSFLFPCRARTDTRPVRTGMDGLYRCRPSAMLVCSGVATDSGCPRPPVGADPPRPAPEINRGGGARERRRRAGQSSTRRTRCTTAIGSKCRGQCHRTPCVDRRTKRGDPRSVGRIHEAAGPGRAALGPSGGGSSPVGSHPTPKLVEGGSR